MPERGMQISPDQGQFMAMLAGILEARRILEIGVFTGYSSLCFALNLPEDGQLVALDESEEWTRVARRYWNEAGVANKIDLRLGPALATLENLIAGGESGKFDIAFIDADKTNYAHYYERSLELVRRGGLIIFDNMLWGGRVTQAESKDEDTEAIRVMNAKLHKDTRVCVSMLSVGDGVTLARKLPRGLSSRCGEV